MSGPIPKSPIVTKEEAVLWDCWDPDNHALNTIHSVVVNVNTVTFTPAYTAPVQTLVTVTTHATPVRLGVLHTFFQHLRIYGFKAQNRTQNAGDVYLGPAGAAGTQSEIIAKGAAFTLDAPIGQKYDLYDFMVDAANDGDGIVIVYT